MGKGWDYQPVQLHLESLKLWGLHPTPGDDFPVGDCSNSKIFFFQWIKINVKPLLVQLVLLPLVCSLCLLVKRKSPSFLQPCMYLYDLTRFCAIGVQFLLLSQNPLLWAWSRTSTHASSTCCLMLFAPGTFLSCAMQQLYFVICSISTLEYQFTALRYSVSLKSEKWRERNYITGLVLQSQPATSRIALQGFPPSKTSSSSPKVLLPQPLRQFAHSILKPDHLYYHDALHLTLKGNWRDSSGIFEASRRQPPGCLPVCSSFEYADCFSYIRLLIHQLIILST